MKIKYNKKKLDELICPLSQISIAFVSLFYCIFL